MVLTVSKPISDDNSTSSNCSNESGVTLRFTILSKASATFSLVLLNAWKILPIKGINVILYKNYRMFLYKLAN